MTTRITMGFCGLGFVAAMALLGCGAGVDEGAGEEPAGSVQSALNPGLWTGWVNASNTANGLPLKLAGHARFTNPSTSGVTYTQGGATKEVLRVTAHSNTDLKYYR